VNKVLGLTYSHIMQQSLFFVRNLNKLQTFIETAPRKSSSNVENESRSSFVRELTCILRAKDDNHQTITIVVVIIIAF